MSADMQPIYDTIAAIQNRIGTKRETNRRNFPEAARVMDALAAFEPRMIWWQEGGHTLGRVP